jgi:hypothetical protein
VVPPAEHRPKLALRWLGDESVRAQTVITTQRSLAADGGYRWTDCATRQIPDQQDPGRVVLISSIRDIANRNWSRPGWSVQR